MRMIHAVPLAISLALPLLAAPVRAQQPAQTQPSQADRAACTADFKKLCAGVQPGGGRALACLSKQKEQLTPDCRAVVEKHGG